MPSSKPACSIRNILSLLPGIALGSLLIGPAQAAPSDDFVTTWQTDNPGTSGPTSITVPMVGGPYQVDWNNDGAFDETVAAGTVTHDFGAAGSYTIRINGDYDAIQLGLSGEERKILSVDQWGTGSWQTMHRAFEGAVNLTVPAADVPDLSAVTDLSFMFAGAAAADPDTSAWDTASVTTMQSMFDGAAVADPDTGSWDTSSVTSMRGMFFGAANANPDTSGWDTSSVTEMAGLFGLASRADPDTSGWNTASVTSMASMFFRASAADPDTSGWNTSALTNMSQLFLGATSANPDTSNWDTSSVTLMIGTFALTTSANPDISGWDTSSVTTMERLFQGASAIDPDVSGWDVGALTDGNRMFDGSGLTTETYEAVLESWSLQALQTGVRLGAADSFHCSDAAADARQLLIDDSAWVIDDQGLGCMIGGSVSGLDGSGLVLQLNGVEDLSINANGAFTFPGSLGLRDAYTVTVATQPSDPAQTCAVTNRGGTVSGPNITDVEVNCVTDRSDLAVTASADSGLVVPGAPAAFIVTVENSGPLGAEEVLVEGRVRPALPGIAWQCEASGGARCGTGGQGDLTDTISLPAGGEVRYSLTATTPEDFRGSATLSVSVAEPDDRVDPDRSNNAASATIRAVLPVPSLAIFAQVVLALVLLSIGVAKLRRRV